MTRYCVTCQQRTGDALCVCLLPREMWAVAGKSRAAPSSGPPTEEPAATSICTGWPVPPSDARLAHSRPGRHRPCQLQRTGGRVRCRGPAADGRAGVARSTGVPPPGRALCGRAGQANHLKEGPRTTERDGSAAYWSSNAGRFCWCPPRETGEDLWSSPTCRSRVRGGIGQLCIVMSAHIAAMAPGLCVPGDTGAGSPRPVECGCAAGRTL